MLHFRDRNIESFLIKLQNRTDQGQKIVLRIPYNFPVLATTLTNRKLSEGEVKPLYHRYPSFRLLLEPGMNVFQFKSFMDNDTDGYLTYNIFDLETWEEKKEIESHIEGFGFGTLVVMGVFNFGMWLVYRYRFSLLPRLPLSRDSLIGLQRWLRLCRKCCRRPAQLYLFGISFVVCQ